MKLDLLLEYKGAPALIAWARETSLGVYMGVRFLRKSRTSRVSQDGRRELLRFPVAGMENASGRKFRSIPSHPSH